MRLNTDYLFIIISCISNASKPLQEREATKRILTRVYDVPIYELWY